MKVAFNARLLHSPELRGWNRYTINLLAELPALGVEPLLYVDRPVHADHLARLPEGSYTVRVSPPMRYFAWEQRWLPRQCRADGADVLHTPLNFGLPWSSPCPRVLTLHDAISHTFENRRVSWRQRLSPGSLRSDFHHWVARTRAHRVITVSEHSKADLIRALGIPAGKIDVTYEAADAHFHAPVPDDLRRRAREAHGLTRPYVFYIGGWEARKNIPFLVRAFAEAKIEGVDLVLAGGRSGEKAELSRLAETLGVTDRLRLLGWVDDADLPALYAEALAFVYPSAYEGFGLQLCEAMATGCPALASRATSLPEVLGKGGDTFSLESTGELSGLLRRVVNDDDYRRELSRRARARSEEFSWRLTAEETLAVYRRAAADAGTSVPGRVTAAPSSRDARTSG
jgi:glycosyltransferase involved in cell wall biosynthesis